MKGKDGKKIGKDRIANRIYLCSRYDKETVEEVTKVFA